MLDKLLRHGSTNFGATFVPNILFYKSVLKIIMEKKTLEWVLYFLSLLNVFEYLVKLSV